MPVARLLQLTDCHLLEDPQGRLLKTDTAATLENVVEEATSNGNFDAILATGDLAHEATRETYRRFLDIVRRRSIVPILATPGNHDLGEPFDAVFRHIARTTMDFGGWRLVAVDTHVDDHVEGAVSNTALAAFEAEFAGHEGFRIAVGHHPLAETGTPWLDKDRIGNADEFLGVLQKMDVSAYVFGHLHQSIDELVDDVRVLGTPSTCFQFAAGTASFSIDDEKPGYRTIDLFDDGRIESEVIRVG